jgi:hypothetical protein
MTNDVFGVDDMLQLLQESEEILKDLESINSRSQFTSRLEPILEKVQSLENQYFNGLGIIALVVKDGDDLSTSLQALLENPSGVIDLETSVKKIKLKSISEFGYTFLIKADNIFKRNFDICG